MSHILADDKLPSNLTHALHLRLEAICPASKVQALLLQKHYNQAFKKHQVAFKQRRRKAWQQELQQDPHHSRAFKYMSPPSSPPI
eukprot:7946822-Karenia_brevis.AAC.1